MQTWTILWQQRQQFIDGFLTTIDLFLISAVVAFYSVFWRSSYWRTNNPSAVKWCY